MANWLFKEEPSHYSFADLERDGRTVWDGVSNHLALKNLRRVKARDRVWFYHTGKEKAIVGEMRVVEGCRGPSAELCQEPRVVVRPVRRLHRPVTLAEMKKDRRFADWELVRIPRLSVMPVSAEQWARIEELARAEASRR